MLKKSFRKILPLCIALVIVFSGIQTVFASYESEPNDNFDNANDIYSGSPMSGSSYVGDPDYYVFTVDDYDDGDVSIGLCGSTNVTWNDLDLKLYRSNNTLVAASTRYETSIESISETLEPGTYYIKVYAYQGGDEYMLNFYLW